MALTWGNIRSLALFFGPILLPKAIGYYNNLRRAQQAAKQPIVPVPSNVLGAITFLAVVIFVLILKATPFFAPENVFITTQSRLQIPVDVLFNRLASLRPGNTLTLHDEALRARFVNVESRLLYFQFGPDAIAECPFCRSDDPTSYFYYALPALLAPHVANLLALAAVTSRPLTGIHGALWRQKATLAAVAIACADVYLTQSFDARINASALRLGEINPFYWRARSLRLLSLALLDGALGAVLYLSSTNRLFATPPSQAVRLRDANRAIASLRSKISALGIVRNAGLRDEGLLSKTASYWAHEVRLMGEIMEEREVVEGINDAIGSGRINVERIEQDAEEYAAGVVAPHMKSGQERDGNAAPTTLVG